MWFKPDDFNFFWLSRWFHPLRSACPHLSEPARQKAQKGRTVPTWLRPIYIQCWIGKAVAQRAAWLAAHPKAAPYRFVDSEPCWVKQATIPYGEQFMRKLTGSDFWWLFDVDLERLLRIMQADPNAIGQDRWTQAALGTCGHLTQAYRELARRVGTRRARSLVREELWLFVLVGTQETQEIDEQEQQQEVVLPPAVLAPVVPTAAIQIPLAH